MLRAGDEDKRVLHALLVRMRALDYQPTVEERAVLAGCERRALRYGLGAGAVAAYATAVVFRRLPAPGLLGTVVRTTAVSVAGSTAAVGASSWTADACLGDLIALAESSPLGGEAVRLLYEANPASPTLRLAPKAARWAPESLPRLPEPHSGEVLRARLAARPPRPKEEPSADGWGGAERSVFDDLLQPAPAAERSQPQQRPGGQQRRAAS